MNLGSLRQVARIQLDDAHPLDPARQFWSDEELNMYLNEAENEAARRGLLLESTELISVVSGTAIYTLAAHPIFPQRALLDDRPLRHQSQEWVDMYHPDWMYEQSHSPLVYLLTGDTVQLAPGPLDAGTLAVTYYRYPTAPMALDADSPGIPAEYHLKLLHWVWHRCFDRRDADTFSPTNSAEQLALFEAAFGGRPSARFDRFMKRNPQNTTVNPRAFASTRPSAATRTVI